MDDMTEKRVQEQFEKEGVQMDREESQRTT